MNKLPNIRNIMPSIKGLNLWTLTQKLKDRTVAKTPTFQLLQRIDIIKWSNPQELAINQRMLSIYSFAPRTNPNLRFKSNLNQAKNRFIKMHGKVDRSTGTMKSHSFVLQFLQALELVFAHKLAVRTSLGDYGWADALTTKDTSGINRTHGGGVFSQTTTTGGAVTYGLWAFEANNTDSTFGIQVGAGSNAPASQDYTIQTLIVHGVGANQLYYGACQVSGAIVAGANVDMSIVRLFGNSSGGAVTIREIALVGGTNEYDSTYSLNGNYYYLFAHDSVNQQVANGETAIVIYTMRTTV
jgi:hypothetical protein